MSAAAEVLAVLRQGVPEEHLHETANLLRFYASLETPIRIGEGTEPGYCLTFHEYTAGPGDYLYQPGERAYVRQRADGLFVLWHEHEPWDATPVE